MLCLLAAAYASIGYGFLIERDAARADACQLLDLILALFVTAPHRATDAVTFFGKRAVDLVNGLAVVGAVVAVFKSLLIHTVANGNELFCNCFFNTVKRNKALFAVVTGYDNALVALDVARTYFDSQRNALHLVFGILPAGRVVL